jgi:hypothetical protein
VAHCRVSVTLGRYLLGRDRLPQGTPFLIFVVGVVVGGEVCTALCAEDGGLGEGGAGGPDASRALARGWDLVAAFGRCGGGCFGMGVGGELVELGGVGVRGGGEQAGVLPSAGASVAHGEAEFFCEFLVSRVVVVAAVGGVGDAAGGG